MQPLEQLEPELKHIVALSVIRQSQHEGASHASCLADEGGCTQNAAIWGPALGGTKINLRQEK